MTEKQKRTRENYTRWKKRQILEQMKKTRRSMECLLSKMKEFEDFYESDWRKIK